MKYTSRADQLIAAGESIKMQEKAGIIPTMKTNGRLDKELTTASFCLSVSQYEFPLAVVEGKPVFVGDELYDAYKRRVKAEESKQFTHTSTLSIRTDGRWYPVTDYSWVPPKSTTVMVELLVEDAETCIKQYGAVRIDRIAEACRKALEK